MYFYDPIELCSTNLKTRDNVNKFYQKLCFSDSEYSKSFHAKIKGGINKLARNKQEFKCFCHWPHFQFCIFFIIISPIGLEMR